MKRFSFVSILVILSLSAKKAVFIEPVTDLGITGLCINEAYDSTNSARNKRSHQALFNEICTILEQKDGALKISLPSIVYRKKSEKKKSTFWAPIEAVHFIDECGDTSAFPQERIVTNGRTNADATVCVLTEPMFDGQTQRMYSTGTRFVRSFEDTHTKLGVRIYNPQLKKVVKSHVPKKKSRIEKQESFDDAQKEFVAQLYRWASKKDAVIPYVWGGSSCMSLQQDGTFYTDAQSRIVYPKKTAVTGYDCSELILRATQIAGLPYVCKITAVIPDHLQPLQPHEKLEDGDLLWYTGHVMVVGSVKRNEIIESRGYPTGYGKVHCVAVNTLFPAIKNYDELCRAYFNHEPITVVCKDGSFFRKITDFTIYKLRSIAR